MTEETKLEDETEAARARINEAGEAWEAQRLARREGKLAARLNRDNEPEFEPLFEEKPKRKRKAAEQ